MAETAVLFAIDKLLFLVGAGTSILGDLPTQLASINNELGSIRVFLKDAEQQAEENEAINEWVRQVRKIAYRIEDVIDEHIILQYRRRRNYKFLRNWFCDFGQRVVLIRPMHRLANAIKSIHSEIIDISRRRSDFSLDRGPSLSNGDTNELDPRAGFLYVDGSELVGIDIHKTEIFTLLVRGSARVISVVGMGGIGKTTLVRKVFEELSVKKFFHLRAWVTVSQNWKTVDILRSMFKQFLRSAGDLSSREIDSMDEDFLVEELRNYSEQHRFLVVYDDVWDIGTYLKDILPTNNNGNRILVTTRLEDVASAWTNSYKDHVYKLPPLSPEMAWELFCWKTFRDSKCPPELEKLSRAIVSRCEGLTLAIVSIGGLLSTKNNNVMEWHKLSNSIGAELGNNRHLTKIKKILLLSYHELPHYLKPCFLYMGIFPGDQPIHCRRLRRLWIAEGFIPSITGKSLEDVADEYLSELVRRNLVQVNTTDVGGRCTGLRVHDLIREIILLKSAESSFCQVLDERNGMFDAQNRRLSIQDDKMLSSFTKDVLDQICSNKLGLRSLFCFQGSEALPKFITDSFTKSVHLLRVLDLQGAPIDQIPDAAGCLYQLHYLSLRRTNVKMLPQCISKLGNLQTLDLKHTPLVNLPTEISRMSKLRHLTSYNYHWDDNFSYHVRNVNAAKLPAGICNNCPEMQNLGWVDANKSVGLIDQLGNLKQLRRLGIAQLKKEDGKKLCDAVKNMNQLQSLMIAARNKNEVIDLDYVSSPPPMLRRLLLMGHLEKVPIWISELSTVVKVVLSHSSFQDDPLKHFETLPNLKQLTLSEAFDGVKLHFGANKFQKLKVLRLYSLPNLISVEIEPNSLPILEEFQLGPCPKMKEVPEGIKHLKKLALLRFRNMPEKLTDTVIQGRGQFYHIIQHIPISFENVNRGPGLWEATSLRFPHDRKLINFPASH